MSVRPEYLMNPPIEWIKHYRKKTIIQAIQVREPFDVETLEGTMHGNAGDYLARGAAGEFYPIKKEIFEQTYEAI